MDRHPPIDDYIGKVDDAPEGVPEAGFCTPTTPLQSKAACDNPSQGDSLPKQRSDVELNRQVSLPLSLEPPPVMSRPPKIKSDSFGFGNLSLFSWNRTEQKDVPACSRSTHRSYTHDATLRFLGFNITTSMTYKISDGGLDTAVESVRFVSTQCRTRRLQDIWGTSDDNTQILLRNTLFKGSTK
jgi:hypothetical protein